MSEREKEYQLCPHCEDESTDEERSDDWYHPDAIANAIEYMKFEIEQMRMANGLPPMDAGNVNWYAVYYRADNCPNWLAKFLSAEQIDAPQCLREQVVAANRVRGGLFSGKTQYKIVCMGKDTEDAKRRAYKVLEEMLSE